MSEDDDSWDACASFWDTDETVIEYSNKSFNSLCDCGYIKSNENDNKFQYIMDFGCGTGLLTEKLALKYPNATIIGLDISTLMINVLNHKNISNIQTISSELNKELINKHELLKNIKFDLIVCSSVLAFVPNYKDTIDCLYSILKTNGILYSWDWEISETNKMGLQQSQVAESLSELNIPMTHIDYTRPFKMSMQGNESDVFMVHVRKE